MATGTIMKVPVTKGKGFIEVDTGLLPDAVYAEVLLQGLKALANRGTTKITKSTYENPEELKVAAMAKAQEQVEAMYAGKIRATGAKTDKVSGAVMTEARRIARNMVKDEMKRQKIKVSYVDAKDITAAANQLISDNPEIVEQAKTSIEARNAEASKVASALSGIASSIPISEKKKAKVEEEKAKAKEQLSKTQAGKAKTRAKPAPATA